MKRYFTDYSKVPVVGRFRYCLELLLNENLKGKILLDVGSSNGLLTSKLLQHGLKEIYGVEPNKSAVDFARNKISKATFFQSTADKIPLGNSKVDIVTLFDVIEHVPQNSENEVFEEIARVLKKGGVLFLSTPNNNPLTNFLDPAWYFGHRHYTETMLTGLLKKSGFKIEMSEVRGSVWSSIYMLWFYFSKWILGKRLPRNEWFESNEDEGYNKPGIFTLFIKAKLV